MMGGKLTLVILFLSALAVVRANPKFNNLPNTITIGEDLSVVTTLIMIDTREDERPHTFSIDWPDSNPSNGLAPFYIDPNNGSVFYDATMVLDTDIRTQYKLRICTEDRDNDDKCDDLTIFVVDVPAIPVWQRPNNSTTVITIPETTPVGSLLYDCLATDRDAGDFIQYSIKSITPMAAPIQVNQFTGALLTTGMFDYEYWNDYLVTLEAFDGTTAVPETLRIKVTDVNELPSLDIVPDIIEVNEDFTGQSLLYSLNDPDPEGDPITYSLVCNPPPCPFWLDGSGNIWLNDSISPLDYETLTSYQFSLTVDDGTDSFTKNVTVNVVDVNEPPVFLNMPNSSSSSEDYVLANPDIYQVLLSDPENDNLIFYLTAQDDPTAFTINANDGKISVAANPGFDYERDPFYKLVVHVSDGANMVGPEIFWFNITDVNEAPVIKNMPDTISLSEEIAVSLPVFWVYTEDEDFGDVMTYTMVDPSGKFGIDNETGVISTSGAPGFDWGVQNTFTLTVTVTDTGGLTDVKTLTVNIGEAPQAPVFAVQIQTLYIAEEQPVNSAVAGANIVATDNDVSLGDVLTYVMDTSTPGSANFWLDTSGATPVLRWRFSIDREAIAGPIFYNLKFTVTDTTSRSDEMWVTVVVTDANDNNPVFARPTYTTTIQENFPTDGSVLTVTATDLDVYLAPPTYYIDPANTLALTHFRIDANSGTIYGTTPPDYETNTYIAFDVYTTDGANTDVTAVNVTITDANDNVPVFEYLYYNFEVRWDAEADFVVGQIKATDVDLSSIILYSLESMSSEFYIENRTGLIRVKAKDVLQKGKEYTLYAIAKDSLTYPIYKTTAAAIRIDAYQACDHVLTFEIQRVASTFDDLANSTGYTMTYMALFLQQVGSVFPMSLARIVSIDDQSWPVFDGIGAGGALSTLKVILLEDTSTEVVTSIGTVTKDMYKVDDLLDKLKDGDRPSSALLSALQAEFPVEDVSVTSACPTTPKHWWTDTTEGRATQSVLAMVGIAALGLTLGVGLYHWMRRNPSLSMCKKGQRLIEPTNVQKAKVPKGDQLPDFRYNKKDPAKFFKTDEHKRSSSRASEGGRSAARTPTNVDVDVQNT